MISQRKLRRASAIVAVAAAALVGVAACAGSGSDSGAEGVASSQGPSAQPFGTPNDPPADGDSSQNPEETKDAVTPTPERLQREASIDLTVSDVDEAATKVRRTASSVGGQISSEQISTSATVVVEVPTERLEAALDALEAIGVVDNRSLSTTNVTSEYVDTEARIRTAKASVARLRALMSTATKLSDIVALEGELSSRQGDLESLQSRFDELKNTTATAPITVELTPDDVPGARDHSDTGFLAGLTAGWSALLGVLAASATALGALLPFLAALALVAGAPAWLLRRRFRRTHFAPPVASEGD
ncbi:DUF4349 domain-containing protein [Janibacter sp. GXQ6167]|uniref:DUF4349 domain-containing protein n=1 Tax=Janibacter sp. GXQ6167 TaxID=3240791 RepID=UPI00352694CF